MPLFDNIITHGDNSQLSRDYNFIVAVGYQGNTHHHRFVDNVEAKSFCHAVKGEPRPSHVKMPTAVTKGFNAGQITYPEPKKVTEATVIDLPMAMVSYITTREQLLSTVLMSSSRWDSVEAWTGKQLSLQVSDNSTSQVLAGNSLKVGTHPHRYQNKPYRHLPFPDNDKYQIHQTFCGNVVVTNEDWPFYLICQDSDLTDNIIREMKDDLS